MILLLMKAPLIGFVKTRLAASIGDEKALAIYKKCVAKMFEALKASGKEWRVVYDPPNSAELIRDEFGSFEGFVQTSGDLGARMKHAFEQAFEESSKAVLIGSDAPQIDATLLNEALEALTDHDCVIVPALDGGYALIGFTAQGYTPEVFVDMTWSVSTVFEETLKRLGNRSVKLLKTIGDIDTIDDYMQLKEYL